MKKGVAILLALVILSQFTLAESYDLEDFSEKPAQGIVVGEKDEVRFNLFNATHTIVFNRVKDVGFRFTGYAYMKDEYQMTGFATKKWSSHVDVNRDNVSDLIVAFYDSEVDEKTNKTYATAIFKLEDNQITSQAPGVEAKGTGVVKDEDYTRYLTVIGAIAFILILILMARKNSKQSKEEKKVEPAGSDKEE